MPEPSEANTRRRIAIALGVIAVVGFAGGALANQVLARFLALPEGAEIPEYAEAEPKPDVESVADAKDDGLSTSARAPRPRALSEKQYADVIVRRNIFDSSAVYDPDAAKAANGDGECRSDANVRLLATVVAEVPEFSSALIATGAAKDGKTLGYAMGEEVGGEGRIVLIEQKKVCLDGGSCLCIGADAARPTSAAAGKEGGGDGGVEKLSDNKFAVDGSLLEESLSNFEQLAGQLRVTPHKVDGKVDGYRLSAIRRGSLFDKLGIKNGDVVHGVNGNALTSTEAAMQVYQSLKSEKSFSFDISRRNQRQTLEYEVR